MNASSLITVAASVMTLHGLTFAGGDWNPTGTSNTSQAISRSGNVSTTGNVGVGMTNPTYKLDVTGSFHVANGNQAVFSGNSTAASPAVTFYGNTGTGFFNPGSAQNIGFATNAAERMRITQDGIVGINTTSPASGYKLDINGKMKVADNNQAIFSGANSVTNPAISFNNDDNTGMFHPTGSDVVALATAGQERMRVDDQGRVGIGTTNPDQNYKLHVNGAALVNGQLNVGTIPAYSNAASLFLVSNNGVVSSRTAAQVLSDIGAGNGGSGAHGVTTGYVPYANGATTWATSPVSVDAAGKVGIGKTNPGSTLDVNGTITASGTITTSTGFFCMAMNGGNAATLMGPVQLGSNVGIGQDPGTEALEVAGNIRSTGSATVEGAITTSTGLFSMAMHGGNAATFMGPAQLGGNVGIGQDPGTEALEVAGTIKCDAVKIKNWTIEAPDYVFDEGYKLPNLKAVEKHIAAEKHLPGVPSAAEMKKNGVDLSQMNMTLLKKVEELTLYVIEQNKKIEALEKKVKTSNAQ